MKRILNKILCWMWECQFDVKVYYKDYCGNGGYCIDKHYRCKYCGAHKHD